VAEPPQIAVAPFNAPFSSRFLVESAAAHLFFQLVSRRYETGAMLITSNRSVAEWGMVFAEPTLS